MWQAAKDRIRQYLTTQQTPQTIFSIVEAIGPLTGVEVKRVRNALEKMVESGEIEAGEVMAYKIKR